MVSVDEDIDGKPLKSASPPPPEASKPKFAASKWETVDEEVVKAQGKQHHGFIKL